MALWYCPVCGYEREARCKPQKCPQCEEKRDFAKKEEQEKKK
ncbi:MAG TPA: rubredoxin [Bacillota bacterium]|jgi:rubrerythrin|nr:rubredoxin [Bacillota bacterium]HOB86903.1 rubredoxin [Bacillota bacterium]HOP68270.1 rubredoxin [Bacillota bacterium]HPT33140.1 rubredoxin [Bacillota bacterium]HPZ65235.1 rubredoxin [Bacillota bacterium]